MANAPDGLKDYSVRALTEAIRDRVQEKDNGLRVATLMLGIIMMSLEKGDSIEPDMLPAIKDAIKAINS